MVRAYRWSRGAITLLVVCMLSLGPLAQAMMTWQEVDVRPVPSPVLESPTVVAEPDAVELLSNIDGYFTENRGQKGEGAGLFYCQGETLSVSFGQGWVAYDYLPEDGEEGAMFRVTFEGANEVEPIGIQPLDHKSNYFIGNDPDGWVTGASNYREVEFPDLYDGIDLRFHFRSGYLKYDYIVEPGADPSRIVQVYEGIEDLTIDEGSGDLEIHCSRDTLIDTAPLVHQPDGKDLIVVTSRFRILDGNRLSFDLGEYYPRLPLFIDPGLVFSTYVGGTRNEDYSSAYVDHEGNVYVGGSTSSRDFPTTLGSYDPQYTGASYEGIIFKLNKDGSKLVYCTYLGGSTDDSVSDLHVTLNGTVYAVGSSHSADFPTTTGGYQENSKGGNEGFISMLNPSGSKLFYSTFIGGSSSDGLSYISLAGDGKIVVGGFSQSNDFPVTAGCYMNNYPGGRWSQTISKFDKTAKTLLASTYVGGSSRDWGFSGLELDGKGDIYVIGTTQSTDLPTSSKSYQSTAPSGRSTYEMKLSSSLTEVLFCTYLGGSGANWCKDGILLDNGSMIIVGRTLSDDFPTTEDAADRTLDGETDVFFSVINETGEGLLYSTYIGGDGGDGGAYLGYYSGSELALAFSTSSDNLTVSPNAYDTTYNGDGDFYIGLYNLTLFNQTYGSYIGGNASDIPCFIAGGLGDLTVVGFSRSDDFPTSLAAYSDTRSGDADIVVSRIYIEPFNGSIPSAPENLKVIQGNRTTILSWQPPNETSDLPVIAYKLYKGKSADNLTLHIALGQSTRMFEDYLVKTGETYFYAVSAITFVGEGNLSEVVSVLAVGPPYPPEVFEAFPGDGNVTLTWRPPSNTGGLPIIGYVIKRGTSKFILKHIDEIGNVTSYVDTTVENGVTYHYTVHGLNTWGSGEETELVEPVMPVGSPTEPHNLYVRSGDSNLTLEWRAPVSHGGRSVLGYRIYRGSTESSLSPLVAVGEMPTEYVDTNLTNGVVYHYAVLAFNELGDGRLSIVVNGTPLGVPLMPLDLQTIPGDSQVTLGWRSPLEDGGTELLSYLIHRGPSVDQMTLVAEVAPEVTKYVDTGLVNGRLYFYAVSATNSVGEGPPSARANAVPIGPPDPPLDLYARIIVGSVLLEWYPPVNTGGLPLTGYTILRGVSEDELVPVGQTEVANFTDPNPPTGVYLYYAVSAINSAGIGAVSLAVEIWPQDIPDPPADLSVEPGLESVSLTWGPPEHDGGSKVTAYQVLRSNPLGDLVLLKELAADDRSYDDNIVIPGRTYQYTVLTMTALGKSERVDPVTVVPYSLPGVPTLLSHEIQGSSVVLTWSPPTDTGWAPIVSYRVYRGDDPDSLFLLAVVETTTYTDTDVEADGIHHYAVSVVNAGGEGPKTASMEAGPGVPQGPPGPPQNVRATTDGTTVTLRWDPPAFEGGSPIEGYAIFRGPSEDSLMEIFRVGAVTKHVDRDLPEDVTYVYAVVAFNDAGMGELSRPVEVQVQVGPGIIASPLAWLLVGLITLGIIAGIAAVSEPFKYSLLILLLPLFSRIHKEEVLDNKTRFAILGIIMERPGIHYSALREEFGLSNGGAAHHLDVLERENFIRSVSEGRRKCFYTVHTKVPDKRRMTPEEIRDGVMDLVARQPGISQLQVIEELGIDRDTVGYHLRSLVTEDVLHARKKGRYTVYIVNGKR